MTRDRTIVRWYAFAPVLVVAGSLFSPPDAVSQTRQRHGVPTGDVQGRYVQWPLPPGAERYADIDGRRMHRDVVEQAEISRRYRDADHPKFWGRITGTTADAECAAWLADKFRSAGISDVRIQSLYLLPQWFPRS